MSLHVLPLHAGLCLHVRVYALLSLAVWILNMRNYGLLVYKKKKRTQNKKTYLGESTCLAVWVATTCSILNTKIMVS